MTRIAVLTPSLTTGDAVSNDVFGMCEALKRRGYDARIYAEGWSALDNYKIWPAHKVGQFLKSSTDLLIYHYSRGWDYGLTLIRDARYRTAVKYHNVTPPDFFFRFSEDLARMCLEGRNQLREVAGADCDVYMSASAYNERELLEEGVAKERSHVVPPFHHIDRLNALRADPKVLEAYEDGCTNLLMVGRISPNKGHAALIEAFAAYHRDYDSESRLLIVGKEETRLRVYGRWLREIARHLLVEQAVIFTGEVSDQELKAYYGVANVFMMTSEHEGFCVPLVEAMSVGVPIVAYASSAIPGTVGGAGLVWAERDPYLLAESVHLIMKNEETARMLSQMGLSRYAENFTNQKIEAQFLEAINSLL